MPANLETLAINTIRTLTIDAIQKANSGHPGLPMGAAPMAYALWTKYMNHNPKNPQWANRDRFVLSGGHGSMLLYSLLYLTGYGLELEDLKNFRQWGSKTPGHPEYGEIPGVETTTGPLGQGLSTGAGMALAEAFLAKMFNRPGHEIVDHHTYVMVGDGDMMEGISSEVCSLAGTWGLGKLIVFYDDNKITLDGEAKMTFTEDVIARFRAYNWHTQIVADGNDVQEISKAIEAAKAATDKPSLIAVRTIIGYGSPHKQGTNEAHGAPLGVDEVKATKEFLGWPQEDFYVPSESLEHWREAIGKGEQVEAAWNKRFDAWRAAFPDLAAMWDQAMSGQLPDGWDADLPTYTNAKPLATRSVSGEAINAIAKHIPTFIGGDADLAGSTRTLINGAEFTGPGDPAERNLRFGVREHAMGAIVNGLTLHGGIIKPYSATFLTFSDYMRGAMRLGALMNIPVVYVFTHDSIGVGEDGPTHQPVEHIMSLRLMPNLYVFRPADANESVAAWRTAMTLDGPTTLIFTRQNIPVLENVEQVHSGVEHGAYVLADCEGTPQVILLATGSEVHIALDAYKTLMAEGVKTRVVSMPCWELFEEQDEAYKESVLPSKVTARVSIEAGVTLGWGKYVGMNGVSLGVDRFGASAPFKTIYEKFGLTPDAVAEAARKLL